jgi:hypothetical protein
VGAKILIDHWDGTAWSAATVPLPPNAPTNTTLDAISASGPSDVWAVGTSTSNGTLIEHFNGTAWSVVPSPNPATSDGVGAVSTLPGDAIVWAVGETGQSGAFNPLVLRNG